MKYTPGPWRMTIDGKRIVVEGGRRGDHKRLYCEVDRDDCDAETAEANAVLMTNAPDLLEARDRLASELRDLAWRIGVAADPAWVRAELLLIVERLEFVARTEGTKHG